MPGCIVSAMTASFRSVEKRRRRATPVITSTFENVSDIGVCLGLYLGPPAKAGVRSKRAAVQAPTNARVRFCYEAAGPARSERSSNINPMPKKPSNRRATAMANNDTETWAVERQRPDGREL